MRSVEPGRPPAEPVRPAAVWQLIGVDFTSAPTARKPIVVAHGTSSGEVVRLKGLRRLPRMADFESLLVEPGPWFGAFDLPFGLPRAFVEGQALGDTADAVIASVHARCPTRMDFRAMVDAWGGTREAGRRLPHRATDRADPAGSSTSPLQTRYVPVGFMYYEGFSRLVRADVRVPGLRQGDASRVAVEGYPARLAHEFVGRNSYKNDAGAERLLARKAIVEALEQGRTRLGLRLKLTPGQAGELVADASGDALDAVLCLLQAAWAHARADRGQPPSVDPVEGWIVGP